MDFTDLPGFVSHPRITSLAASPDGGRLVISVQQPDASGGTYRSSLWEVDPTGVAPARRLTFGSAGESAPQFAADGTLYFRSARPDPEGNGEPRGSRREVAAIWVLPSYGEARVVARAPGGLSLVGIGGDGTLVATTAVTTGASVAEDGEARADRAARRPSAILHTGMPIRFWDDEVGAQTTHLVAVDRATAATNTAATNTATTSTATTSTAGAERTDARDLTPRAEPLSLLYGSADLSADGASAAATWTTRARRGQTVSSVVLIEVATGKRRVLAQGGARQSYGAPKFSPDGDRIALMRTTASSPTDTNYPHLEIHQVSSDGRATSMTDRVEVAVGDLSVTSYTWSQDGATLYVTGDLHSRGAILAVDPADGSVREVIADDAVYSDVHVTTDGSALFALRSATDSPSAPVRFDLADPGPTPQRLSAPGEIGSLPGRVEWVSVEVADHPEGAPVEVGAWLCVPNEASTARPAPLMVWIHGGPHGSYNAWSWRWCPWLAVARGYAVLMPDPAMSTGYGHAGLNRGWPRRPDVVWAEVEALADHVLARRPTLDCERTALLGASFGGFLTNWIAGQTGRFDAIVTHAGLYALDQQHVTTDMAAHKVRVHRTPEQVPEWYAAYSPDRHAHRISTPMLITHGNRDYRVPISEALRLWWDLVEAHDGPPSTLPHRFLQFTEQNHWVLSPEDARIWNEVVLDFCDHHVRGIGTPTDRIPAAAAAGPIA